MMGRAGQTSWGRDWAESAAEFARRRARRRAMWSAVAAVGFVAFFAVAYSCMEWLP